MMTSAQALDKAREEGKDLVLITEQAQPPVVKIIELSKHKYQLQQKQAQDRKNAKVQELKEVRFRPFMGEQDFEVRLKKVVEFLEKGHKVRLQVLFRGRRELAKKDFGQGVLDRAIERTAEIATVEVAPKMFGKQITAQLAPVSKKKKENNAKSETENP